jgi:Domain of unknown function (DUF4394)/CHRD domain
LITQKSGRNGHHKPNKIFFMFHYISTYKPQLKTTQMKKQTTQNRVQMTANLLPMIAFPRLTVLARTVFLLLLTIGAFCVNAQVYTTTLTGAAEAPPNASPAIGSATITINNTLNTMRVQSNFSGLTGTTTAAHIHAATPVAGTGTVGVATTTPTFTGFPGGVTSGSYDMTFDMTLASSYNASYITNNGGTTSSAFAALKAAMAAGKSYFNLHSSAFPGGEIRGFLRQACSSVFYAYNPASNRLVSFYATDPGTLLSDVAITGLNSGERLLGIDYRPADGKLYSVTSNASNVGRVVSINRITGAVSSLGALTHTIANSASYALDFNPVPDRIRLFGSDGTSRRFNPNDGSLSGTDTPPAFAAGDVNAGDVIEITQCAYTKSVPGTPNTTLFAIDYLQDLLVRIGGTNGTPSPNAGATTTIGNLGVAAARGGGFDIEPVTNTAYAALVVEGVAKLYTVDTLTGAVSPIANIGTGAPLEGLTIVPCTAPALCSPVVYAYNSANNHLISFNAATPGTLLSDVVLTGLGSGERLLGIDYRPADGLFYSVTTNASSVGRVVSINRTTGSVAPVGAGTHSVLNTAAYGIDFNPVPDRIRLFGDNGTSRRFNQNDGSLAGTDTPPFYVTGDTNFGNTIAVTQCAYTKSVAGTPNTTLFGIDNVRNLLVRIGGVNGTPSPNAGATTSIGALGITADRIGGFDIEPTYNTAYAALTVGGVSQFYIIDTLTGAATLVGNIGGGATVDGMSVLPCIAPVCVAPVNRIYVDANAAGGTGSSWSCAMKELSAAITMANANPAIKSIWVADGVYKPTTGTDRTISMTTLRADLKILGGFAGGEANEVDANPSLNPTIISGDIGVANDMTDNSYRLLNIGGRAASPSGLVIDGFIFEKANADAPGDGDRSVGPAIHSYLVSTSTPVNISRTIFRNNYGRATGAIFLHQTNVTFDNCRFVGNTTNGSGGGVLVYQASPLFNNCVFAGNSATNAGGGFYGNYGTATFSKTTFSVNSAGTGGGIYLNRYTGTITNSVFNANTSISGGGALFVHNAAVSRVTNSTFYGNTAASSGGAIVLTEANSSVTAENNIFYKNTANGMATGAGSDITNFTGGANVYANNILQMNSSVPADNGGAIRNNTRGTDPMFVNEMNAIGADMMWNTADDGLAISGMSAAKNTGDNALAPAGTDFTNSPRIVCAIVDKGAYENQTPCEVFAPLEAFVMNPKAANATGVVANPFNNDLQIRYMGTEKAGVSVAAASGKTMFTTGNIKQGITHVDASNWSTGLYEVMITTASGKRINFKVVKM